jgi:predicted flap endonuclease-1-like 5' DNA nuclease
MTAQSTLLSIALQSSAQDYLLLFLFLIVAIIFIALFYSWWRGVSDEDLDEIIEADANQTTGPAMIGTQIRADDAAEEEEEAEEETAVIEPVVEAEEEEPAPIEPDDLKKIEGVGPKIAELLNNAGIQTYSQLADTDAEQIKQILADAGARYKLADPTSWPAQAKLAAAADWDALQELQDKLSAGRHVD